jgi:hypothetical protein
VPEGDQSDERKKCWRLGAFKREFSELIGAMKETTNLGFGAFKDAFSQNLEPSGILAPSMECGVLWRAFRGFSTSQCLGCGGTLESLGISRSIVGIRFDGRSDKKPLG